MLTRDEAIVDLTMKIQYRIQDSADYLFQDQRPDDTIKDAVESVLREVIGKSSLDEIITENRAGIAIMVKAETQKLMDQYRTGLDVTSVNIQDANPPEAVKDAFDDANKAREDKVRQENQAQAYSNDVVPRARGGAARQVEDAKAYQARVIAEAEGESQRFVAVLNEYEKAPEVTRQRLYIETVEDVLGNTNKVLLDVDSGNSLMYLPLDKMIQSSPEVNIPSMRMDESASKKQAKQRARDVTRERRVR
jgi:membrane protease subunit HflK